MRTTSRFTRDMVSEGNLTTRRWPRKPEKSSLSPFRVPKGGRPMKRIALAVLAVFVAWSVMDFLIHGVILSSSYEATASLWRPMDEMNMSAMYLSVLISAGAFTLIYSLLVAKKGVA